MNFIKSVYAQVATDLPEDALSGSSLTSVGAWLGAIVNIVFYVGVAICLAFAIVGGIKYATSGGDPKNTAAARQTITNAIIGFIVVVGFRFIMVFVLRLMGATSSGAPSSVPDPSSIGW